MDIAIANNTNLNPKKQKGSAIGTIAGLGATRAGAVACLPISILGLNGLASSSKNLSKLEKKEIMNAVDKILDTKSLGIKGVRLNNLDFAINPTSIPDKIFELINLVYATSNGKNAFYGGINGARSLFGERLFKNEVVCNMDKLPTAIFHELGHAFNANNSQVWRVIQKMRTPALIISAGLGIFSAVTKKAVPSEKNDGKLTKLQKAKNFIRNNSGKLAVLSMVPVLAEEAMATIRGNGWAKEFLSSNVAKQVCKGNKFAYLSYLASAAGLGLGAYAATKIKDYFVDKKNSKNC